MAHTEIVITEVNDKAEREAFVDLIYRLNADDPNFVPQLRSEEIERYTPGGNPYFEHARCQLFLASRGGAVFLCRGAGALRCPDRCLWPGRAAGDQMAQ